MTEKRFTVWNAGLLGQYIKKNGTPMHIEEVVDLLNSLTDENKQLKEDNAYLEKRFKEEEWHYDHIDEDRDVWKHKCQELERENEELKEKIDKLEGMLINNGLM